jgi:hypothetical protein
VSHVLIFCKDTVIDERPFALLIERRKTALLKDVGSRKLGAGSWK